MSIGSSDNGCNGQLPSFHYTFSHSGLFLQYLSHNMRCMLSIFALIFSVLCSSIFYPICTFVSIIFVVILSNYAPFFRDSHLSTLTKCCEIRIGFLRWKIWFLFNNFQIRSTYFRNILFRFVLKTINFCSSKILFDWNWNWFQFLFLSAAKNVVGWRITCSVMPANAVLQHTYTFPFSLFLFPLFLFINPIYEFHNRV